MITTRDQRTNLVILFVVVLAFAVAAAAIMQATQAAFRPLRPVDILVLGVLLIIAVVFDTMRVASMQFRFTVTLMIASTVYIAAAVGYGAIVGVVLAGAGTLATELISRRALRKLVFNVAQFVCAAGIAGLVYHAMTTFAPYAPLNSLRSMLVAVLASSLYLAVNSGLFAIVVGTSIGKSPYAIFVANVPGFLLQNVALQAIGLTLATIRDLNAFAFVILLLPLMGPFIAMRGHSDTQLQIQKTIEALADMVDRRDVTTAQHSERVANYVRQIIDELGTIPLAEAEAIILAARVHDLGKIAIPDAVLLKPGRLDEEEYRLMRYHPVAGDEVLSKLSIYNDSLGVVRHHHERYDGHGYPDGVKGEETPLGARIVAVADSYDVMTSDRPYARARSVREGKEELIACKGTHFDPKIVDAFVRVLERQHAPEPSEQRAPASPVIPSPVA